MKSYQCRCGAVDPKEFYPYRGGECKACTCVRTKHWILNHPDRFKAYPWKVYRQKLKDEVYAAYGGYICVCCGETREVFLCLDHINDDGAEHRRVAGAGTSMYKWLKRHGFPPIMQVLCHNCNQAKRFGRCPHKDEDEEAA